MDLTPDLTPGSDPWSDPPLVVPDVHVHRLMKPVAMPLITIEELKRRLDAKESITLLDGRAAVVWQQSDVQIPGSLRVPPDAVDRLLADIPRDRLVVTYCS